MLIARLFLAPLPDLSNIPNELLRLPSVSSHTKPASFRNILRLAGRAPTRGEMQCEFNGKLL